MDVGLLVAVNCEILDSCPFDVIAADYRENGRGLSVVAAPRDAGNGGVESS